MGRGWLGDVGSAWEASVSAMQTSLSRTGNPAADEDTGCGSGNVEDQPSWERRYEHHAGRDHVCVRGMGV